MREWTWLASEGCWLPVTLPPPRTVRGEEEGCAEGDNATKGTKTPFVVFADLSLNFRPPAIPASPPSRGHTRALLPALPTQLLVQHWCSSFASVVPLSVVPSLPTQPFQ